MVRASHAVTACLVGSSVGRTRKVLAGLVGAVGGGPTTPPWVSPPILCLKNAFDA